MNNVAATPNQLKASGFWDGTLILAIATAVAYLISFSYEWAYGAYFGVPLRLIKIAPSDLLISVASFTAVMLLPACYFWHWGGWLFSCLENAQRSFKQGKMISGIFSTLLFGAASSWLFYLILPERMFIYLSRIVLLLLTVCAISVVAAVVILFFKFFHLYLWTWLKRREGSSRLISTLCSATQPVGPKQTQQEGENGFKTIEPHNVAVGFTLVLVFIILSAAAGYGRAVSQRQFYFIEGRDDLAMIRLSDQFIVATGLDKVTGEPENSVVVIPLSAQIVLHQEQIKKICLPDEGKNMIEKIFSFSSWPQSESRKVSSPISEQAEGAQHHLEQSYSPEDGNPKGGTALLPSQ